VVKPALQGVQGVVDLPLLQLPLAHGAVEQNRKQQQSVGAAAVVDVPQIQLPLAHGAAVLGLGCMQQDRK
jgi:hypothetical protein